MPENVYLFTGFPGFIATRIIRKLAKLDTSSQFELLVHPAQLEKAEQEIEQLVSKGVGQRSQFRIHPGDITLPDLGLDSNESERLLQQVHYLFHLAAIYDLAVPQDAAYRVNVLGTQHVKNWALKTQVLKRFVYFSTAYVSGTRTGIIFETELDKGQSFKNFYESTKFEAEVLIQSLRGQIPFTIIRPGIVMGDSVTGETAKFDGPYFIMRFLDRFSGFPIPYIGKGNVPFNLVPVDYIVNAACYLSHQSIGENKVYHLTNPHPHRARDTYRLISQALLDKSPSFTLPASIVYVCLSIPWFRRWVRVEKETIEYFRLKAEYDCSQAVSDLKGAGIECPDFADFIQNAANFYKQHRHDSDKMIPVN